MRILLLTNAYPPEIGGAANLCLELAQALKERGHSIVVVTRFPLHLPAELAPKIGRKMISREQRPEGAVIRINIPQLSRKIPLLREIEHFLYLIGFVFGGLRAGAADIIWTSSPPLEMGYAAILIRLFTKAKVVFNVQDIFPQNLIDLGVLNNKFLIAASRFLEKRIYRRVDRITVMSQGNKDIIDQASGRPESVCVVENWVDTDHIVPGDRKNEFRREYGLGEKIIFSFAGCIADSQDMDIILNSAKRLEDNQDILFLLAANGPRYEATIKRMKELNLKNVRMIPVQPRDKYVELLAASDVGLVTLNPRVRTPTVPSKIKSIMAAARPILASLPMSGDAPKLIAKARCGMVVPAGDGQAFYEAVLKLSTDPKLRENYGKNGREYVVANLSSRSGAQNYENIFSQVIASGK